MNNITVPKQYKSELRDTRSKEYKIACIRDYVKSHKDKVITIADFQEVAGTSAQTYISNLRKSGRLVRHSIKTGRKTATYGYRWIDEPVREEKASNGTTVTVRSIGYEDWPLGDEHTHHLLGDLIVNHIDTNINILNGDEIKGMMKIRSHVRSEYARVTKQRADALEKHQESENDNA